MLPATAKKLFEFIELSVQSDDDAPPVFWLPAEHAAWGRNAMLTDVIREVNSEIAPKRGIVLLSRTDTDERSRRDVARLYGPGKDGRSPPLFSACLAISPSALPLSLELIVQPNRWAAVFIHVPAPSSGFPLPVGYVSVNPKLVGAIGARVGELISKASETSVFWMPADKSPADILGECERVLLG
jgi:hypothetical protein